MICNKCHQDKPETEYQTYFHSTQNVFRTRRQCNQCFNEAKKQYHLKKKGRTCIVCEEIKYETDFPNFKSLGPNDKRRKICKICTSRIEREKGKHTKREENGEPVHWRPNVYNSPQQKELAFELMTALGFTFDEETGMWSKENFKNPDGTFFRVEEKKRLHKEKLQKEVEDLDVWKKIRYLRNKDIPISEISKLTGVNYTAVHKFLQYGKEIKFRN
jgi:hypothetical protein